ncbi:metallophosphoesterase family protein [Natronogracilivirga saccharolytica]|uniref:Metallophosphoesterase family protein n=1 Tax=Natronogracilivirga saccharolytica TaxID=2812953 RepID=A0A8J7SAP2_9BACT|nr:metallophosphoesterase family protein [Natronogracilivirga saccharolytica]MBP3193076.1 metallophosphoesterase family protein [Natronogracilivirga saccharolytica]
MLKIGLISDTHHYLDPRVPEYFDGVDEVWHAGDFGSIAIADDLKKLAPLKGVYGNIDGSDIRSEFPLHQRFQKEGVDVWMTHIGGNPGRYALPIKGSLEEHPPGLFICGHTHILKIARDPDKNNMIYMNPGAAGRHGFHEYRTIVRFGLSNGKVKDVEVINLGKRSEVSFATAK